MDELVSKLSNGYHPVVANRSNQTAKALKQRIDLGYVHIAFVETGTEVPIKLDRANIDTSEGDFEQGKGYIHLEGFVTLNYHKVRCVAAIDLENLQGSATLQTVSDEVYSRVVNYAS